MTETTTYRVRGTVSGTTAVSRLLISKPVGYLLNNCRPLNISVACDDTETPLSSGAFARVSIICADPTVPYLGNGTPETYAEYIAHDVAHPDSVVQPTIQYQASNVLSGSARLRSEINLMQIQNNGGAAMPPAGPTTYPYFPYIVRIYAPTSFTATITVQFL